jgi:hypothetical protein
MCMKITKDCNSHIAKIKNMELFHLQKQFHEIRDGNERKGKGQTERIAVCCGRMT